MSIVIDLDQVHNKNINSIPATVSNLNKSYFPNIRIINKEKVRRREKVFFSLFIRILLLKVEYHVISIRHFDIGKYRYFYISFPELPFLSGYGTGCVFALPTISATSLHKNSVYSRI